MPSHQPEISTPENLPIEARPRPIRDAAGAVERVAVAIEEGRLHFVTTITTNAAGKLAVDVQMVIDQAK